MRRSEERTLRQKTELEGRSVVANGGNSVGALAGDGMELVAQRDGLTPGRQVRRRVRPHAEKARSEGVQPRSFSIRLR